MDKEQFQKLLDKHDWYYSSSDDMRTWARGAEEERVIKVAMTQHDDLYTLYKATKLKMFPKN